MGSMFDKLLNEALGGVGPDPAFVPTVNKRQFLNFVNAIVTSTDQARVDAALARAATLSPEQLNAIVQQTVAIGSLHSLQNAVHTKPERVMQVLEVAKKLFQGQQLKEVMLTASTSSPVALGLEQPPPPAPAVAPRPAPIAGVDDLLPGQDEFLDDDEDEDEEDDDYYDDGDDDGGHGSDEEEAEEEFDVEGDYYSQGEDGGGH